MRNKSILFVMMSLVLALLAACGGEAPATVPTSGAAAVATVGAAVTDIVPTANAAVPTDGAAAVATVAAAVTDIAPTIDAAAPTVAALVPTDIEPTIASVATDAAPIIATAAPAAGVTTGSGKTYFLVPKALGNPYFDTANKGAQEAAKDLGVTVTYQGPATADASQQIQLLNSLIAQNPGGLAISADDSDALVPIGKQAIDSNIPVVTWDSAIAPGGRTVHINQAVSADIAAVQIKMASDLAKGEGKIAILSATSTAPNQNEWIGLMKTELQKPEYAKLQLVDTVYGDDQDEKSYTEAQGLIKKYPDLKVIIAPTTVGIAASARAVQDGNLVGKVFVTGLGTPNQMREYVKNGASPQFALWNPGDLGYLAIQTLDAIATGKIKGKPGDKFTAGKLGDYTIADDSTILLGKPTVFDSSNIDKFDF